MQATVELPQAFSVRDDHEFLPVRHLLARMNPKLVVAQVATGKHVNGDHTVFWGVVYLEGHSPSKKQLEAALNAAGYDFAHNVLVQLSIPLTN
jgi:hypothetical protein